MRLKVSPALVAFPILLALVGCQNSSDSIGGQSRTSQPIREYISLSPNTTELLSVSGLANQGLLGKTESCNYPTNLQNAVNVVKGTTPNFEVISQLQPQRVIVEADLYSEATIQKLKDLKLDVMVVNLKTAEEYANTLIKIASDAGGETTTSEYLDRVYGAYSLLKGNMPEGAKIAVIIGDPTTGYMIQSKNTLLGDYLTKAGATDVGPDTGKFEPITAEKLITLNPDIILTKIGDGEKIIKDPTLKSVPAVAKGHIVGVDPDILLRDGARVDKLLEGIATGIGRIATIKGN